MDITPGPPQTTEPVLKPPFILVLLLVVSFELMGETEMEYK